MLEQMPPNAAVSHRRACKTRRQGALPSFTSATKAGQWRGAARTDHHITASPVAV